MADASINLKARLPFILTGAGLDVNAASWGNCRFCGGGTGVGEGQCGQRMLKAASFKKRKGFRVKVEGFRVRCSAPRVDFAVSCFEEKSGGTTAKDTKYAKKLKTKNFSSSFFLQKMGTRGTRPSEKRVLPSLPSLPSRPSRDIFRGRGRERG